MLSAVTVSLVGAARGGPFVFWDDLPAACRAASELGFDAIELFAPGPDAVDVRELRRLLDEHDLRLAAVGTGAGWVIHKLQLCDADGAVRRRAIDFIRSMIDFGGPLGASAIIGSMQGRASDAVPRPQALDYLKQALVELGEHARQHGLPLIYEPLNRYETNLITTVADGVALLRDKGLDNVRLLADLFHMNIEEADLPSAIRAGAGYIGHVHFVDSNRRAAGYGHTDFKPIVQALTEIGYEGYLSAEALPLPSPTEAAEMTIKTFRSLFEEA
jgi:sugar phosphate isomerase/epimerase